VKEGGLFTGTQIEGRHFYGKETEENVKRREHLAVEE